MRRASITPQSSLGQNEPMIVVEDDEEGSNRSTPRTTPRQSQDIDSPMHNPYLLSPWRDPRETRKHSLPTPSCTSGITASQVRRLSERGGEGSGPSVREQAFLATLCSAPAPTGRRHSVVTISRVPPTLFGRNRRESVAAFPTTCMSKSSSRTILGSRRESIGPPPSSEHRGSVHNLQLDIMDDIVTARKVRMKMWNTSNERVCEVQPLDENSGTSSMRYTTPGVSGPSGVASRRYSDFIGTTLSPIPSSVQKRRSSEYHPVPGTSTASCSSTTVTNFKKPTTGIVCTNTDLISILSTLTSSATEINQCGASKSDSKTSGTSADQKRSRLKASRSNSFDISILHAVNQETSDAKAKEAAVGPSSWFIKRHQPMSKKEVKKKGPTVTFLDDTNVTRRKSTTPVNKVVWDERSGSMIDAELIGNAIEVFLRRGVESPSSPSATTSGSSAATAAKSAVKGSPSSGTNGSSTAANKPGILKSSSPSSWFSAKSGATAAGAGTSSTTDEETSTETCDTSSLCSTLKDLFVK